MARIVILTMCTRSDIQPYLALACGLKQAGFEVTIATSARYETFITGYGIEFRPMAGDPEMLIDKLVNEAGTNPLNTFKVMLDVALPISPISGWSILSRPRPCLDGVRWWCRVRRIGAAMLMSPATGHNRIRLYEDARF